WFFGGHDERSRDRVRGRDRQTRSRSGEDGTPLAGAAPSWKSLVVEIPSAWRRGPNTDRQWTARSQERVPVRGRDARPRLLDIRLAASPARRPRRALRVVARRVEPVRLHP